MEDEAERQSIARIRKPTWIVVGILIFLGFIVWPLLTLPAGDFRYVRWLVIWHCPASQNRVCQGSCILDSSAAWKLCLYNQFVNRQTCRWEAFCPSPLSITQSPKYGRESFVDGL